MKEEYKKIFITAIISMIAFFLTAFYNSTNSQIDHLKQDKEQDRVMMMKLETKLENIEHQAQDMKNELDNMDKKLDRIIEMR